MAKDINWKDSMLKSITGPQLELKNAPAAATAAAVQGVFEWQGGEGEGGEKLT